MESNTITSIFSPMSNIWIEEINFDNKYSDHVMPFFGPKSPHLVKMGNRKYRELIKPSYLKGIVTLYSKPFEETQEYVSLLNIVKHNMLVIDSNMRNELQQAFHNGGLNWHVSGSSSCFVEGYAKASEHQQKLQHIIVKEINHLAQLVLADLIPHFFDPNNVPVPAHSVELYSIINIPKNSVPEKLKWIKNHINLNIINFLNTPDNVKHFNPFKYNLEINIEDQQAIKAKISIQTIN